VAFGPNGRWAGGSVQLGPHRGANCTNPLPRSGSGAPPGAAGAASPTPRPAATRSVCARRSSRSRSGSPRHWPSGRRIRPSSCRFSRPRCGDCSRNCPRRQTGSRGRNDERSKRSPPARTHHRPPSSEHNDSSRPPSSATLVLLSPLNARAGRDQAARNRRRRAASPAAPARRQPALRTPPAAADSNRRMHAPRRSRSSRTARHRRLDRRHAHHVRQHLAMGFDAAQARSTISTLGESGMPRLLPRAIE
jgi:hypothetical protein